MTKKITSSRVLFYQFSGFVMLIILTWLSEIYDIPHHLFGSPATPVNIVEGLYESLLMLFFGASVVIFSHRAINRIKYIEGFMPVCSSCRKIGVDDDWFPIEEYLEKQTELDFSHGLCPECVEKYYTDILHRNNK